MIESYIYTGVIISLCYVLFYSKYKGLGELEITGNKTIFVGLLLIMILGLLFWPIALFEMIHFAVKNRKGEKL